MTWEKIEGSELIKLETEGDSISGKLTHIRENQGEFGTTIIAIETSDGEKAMWCTTVLADRLSRVPLGAMVKIVYLGKKMGDSGREYKDYDVFIDKSNK